MYVGGHGASLPSPCTAPPRHLQYPAARMYCEPCPFGFYGGFIMEARLVKSLAFGDQLYPLATFLFLDVRIKG